MKLIKTASGKKLKLSKSEWESIGKKAGWVRMSETKCHLCDNPSLPGEVLCKSCLKLNPVKCRRCNKYPPVPSGILCERCLKSVEHPSRADVEHQKAEDRERFVGLGPSVLGHI
jgi:hypothetical protein